MRTRRNADEGKIAFCVHGAWRDINREPAGGASDSFWSRCLNILERGCVEDQPQQHPIIQTRPYSPAADAPVVAATGPASRDTGALREFQIRGHHLFAHLDHPAAMGQDQIESGGRM